MGGFFGTISNSSCATDLFYGTDYNSHLGTRVLVLKVNWRNSREIQV